MVLIRPWLFRLLPHPPRAMALWPLILLQHAADAQDAMVMQHERIHLAQQRELLVIPFYVLYTLEYLWRRLRGLNHNQAYLAISFEREAYAYDAKPNYLATRPRMAWVKFW